MTVEPRIDIPRTYVVVSGPNHYNVDLRFLFDWSCDCAGFTYKDTCKHVKLCQEYEKSPDFVKFWEGR